MLDIERVTDRGTRMTASETSLPRENLELDVAWRRLDERRSAIRAAVVAADGRALSIIEVPHARFGPLNLYQWLLFVGAHEARHASQLREIADLLGAPGG